MRAPQIILIVIYAIDLLCAANLHGKQRTGKWSFWRDLAGTACVFGLLIWGGFFNG